MEKKLILAVVLSILVLSIYTRLMAKYYPQPATSTPAQPTVTAPAESSNVATPSVKSAESNVAPTEAWKDLPSSDLISYSTPLGNYKFYALGGGIASVSFKKYFQQNTIQPYVHLENAALARSLGIVYGAEFFTQALKQAELKQVDNVFCWAFKGPGNINYSKVITLFKDKYAIDLENVFENSSSANWEAVYEVNALVADLSTDPNNSRFDQVWLKSKDGSKAKKFNPRSLKNGQVLYAGPINWVGLKGRYFSTVSKPTSDIESVIAYKENNLLRLVFACRVVQLAPFKSASQKITIYTGPNDPNIVQASNLGIEEMFDPGILSSSLLYTLKFFYHITKSLGLSIILLSLALFFLLMPLTAKSMRSIKAMQALQPKIEALRQTYKDNPQKINKEIMELYKKNKVNPFSGCLPMVLQIPIFFSLYSTLMSSIELRGAAFLWIKDLSLSDRLFLLPLSLPLLGNEFNLLPVLMAVGMFFQQKFSNVSTGQISTEQQKIMGIMMPIMFGIIFYKMPAGLTLYWLTNTILMLIYYYKIRHPQAIEEAVIVK